METKFCPRCKETKTLDLFNKSTKTKDGLYRYCRACKRDDHMKYREQRLKTDKIRRERDKEKTARQKKESVMKKPEYYKAMKKKYYEENKALLLEKMAEYRLRNKDILREKGRAYYAKHPEIYKSLAAKRRAHQLCATPPWLTYEDLLEIKEIFKEAAKLEKETGIKYHVDHIVPLRGENVCGLHVPWNLQILTAEENMKKGNKFYEEL